MNVANLKFKSAVMISKDVRSTYIVKYLKNIAAASQIFSAIPMSIASFLHVGTSVVAYQSVYCSILSHLLPCPPIFSLFPSDEVPILAFSWNSCCCSCWDCLVFRNRRSSALLSSISSEKKCKI